MDVRRFRVVDEPHAVDEGDHLSAMVLRRVAGQPSPHGLRVDPERERGGGGGGGVGPITRVTAGAVAPIARPVTRTCSTAARLMVGSTPGRARQTGQVCVFGAASAVGTAQAQNILLAVRTWQWTSTPMTASYGSKRGRPGREVTHAPECRTRPGRDAAGIGGDAGGVGGGVGRAGCSRRTA